MLVKDEFSYIYFFFMETGNEYQITWIFYQLFYMWNKCVIWLITWIYKHI